MDSDLSNLTGYEMYNNYLPSFLSIPITIFLTLIMVMGILGNTCVTIIFKPNRMPITTNETVNNLLLYYLAIADLVNCLLCIPAEIIEFNTYGQVRHYTCQVVMAISMVCGSINCYLMILLSFERYLAVRRKPLIINSNPLHPRRRWKIYYFSVISCWILSCAISTVTLLKLQYQPRYFSCLSIQQLEVNLMIAKLAYPVLKALIDYSIPEVAITDKDEKTQKIFYLTQPGDPYDLISSRIRMYSIPSIAWNTFLFFATFVAAITSFTYIRLIISKQEQRQSTQLLQKSVLQVASVVIGVFLLSYGPVFLMGSFPQKYNSLNSAIIRSISVSATNIRSFTNPIVYFYKHRKFRDKIRKLLRSREKQVMPEISHTSGLFYEQTANVIVIESYLSTYE
ncbi:hypothetical protein TrispH2_009694 [Trichoplax sp. H2]|nr:hypothetical protein TrispH2_009694 [Trichoplax sp. H2]|eukprot:RDD38647.1 hypothetical protein TrispH2_009694 [Trichoplax sp. H2]